MYYDPVELRRTAHQLVAAGRGILACDESDATMDGRLKAIGVEPTKENRDAWRRIVFSAPQLAHTLSGIIVNPGTLENAELRELLQSSGVRIIVKADGGLRQINDLGEPGMIIPEDIAGKLQRWKELGADGTKFRSLYVRFRFRYDTPSDECHYENAAAQASLAAMSQAMGLVPMVEPEFDMEGEHSLEEAAEVTHRMLNLVFRALQDQNAVDLNAMVLKTNMVVSGKHAPNRVRPKAVADATLRCLMAEVPSEVPGISFLSGGQGEAEFNENLNEITKLASRIGAPWQLTYSSGRSVQDKGRMLWAKNADSARAQAVLLLSLIEVNAARQGRLYG